MGSVATRDKEWPSASLVLSFTVFRSFIPRGIMWMSRDLYRKSSNIHHQHPRGRTQHRFFIIIYATARSKPKMDQEETGEVIGWSAHRRICAKRKTRPDTRHKMRLVCVLFTFENNTGRTYGRTDGRTDGRKRHHKEMRRRI